MRAGILYAIAACSGWGFAFVGPLILSDWPGLAVAAGRYMAYGLGSVLTLLILQRRGTARLGDARVWRDVTLLTLSGNLLYYALLSVSVQKAGYVMPTLIIGLLPVTVSLAGRLRMRQPLSWRYGWALLLILGGLWLAHEPAASPAAGAVDGLGTGAGAAAAQGFTADQIVGLLCAFGSLALWTGYGVLNTDRLKAHAGISGLQWSSLQGTAALPFSLLLFAVTRPAQAHASADWLLFGGVSLFLGLVTSWAANALWNMSSTRLPPSLLGQMIVFETIAGIAYGAVWSGALPGATVLIGTGLLIAGVVVALGERSPDAQPQPA